MDQVRKDILNGWKEIANYVGRDSRTVERWEKQRGLPVHRVPGSGRATVYAHMVEIDRWFANTGPDPVLEAEVHRQDQSVREYAAAAEIERSPVAQVRAFESGAIAQVTQGHVATIPEAPGAVGRPVDISAGRGRRVWPVAAGLALVVVAVGTLTWALAGRGHRMGAAGERKSVEESKVAGPYSFDAARTMPGVPYESRVPGVDELYLRGIYSYEQRNAESLKHSAGYFTEATAKDPNYAPAYAGLSNTYNLMREYSVMPDAEAYGKAQAAAERAITLDPKLPQAHASLGFINYFWLLEAPTAEREFRLALQLDPSQAQTHHWFGSMLTHEARYPEALEQLRIAQRLQPTSVAILSSLALALGLSGERTQATTMLHELLNEAPSAPSPHRILAILSLMQPRDVPRWISESRRVAEMRGDREELTILTAAESAYHRGGERAMWKSVLQTEGRLHPPPAPPPYFRGSASAALGDSETAFAVFSNLADRHDPSIIGLPLDPLLGGLRGDPRYAAILARVKIPLPAAAH